LFEALSVDPHYCNADFMTFTEETKYMHAKSDFFAHVIAYCSGPVSQHELRVSVYATQKDAEAEDKEYKFMCIEDEDEFRDKDAEDFSYTYIDDCFDNLYPHQIVTFIERVQCDVVQSVVDFSD